MTESYLGQPQNQSGIMNSLGEHKIKLGIAGTALVIVGIIVRVAYSRSQEDDEEEITKE